MANVNDILKSLDEAKGIRPFNAAPEFCEKCGHSEHTHSYRTSTYNDLPEYLVVTCCACGFNYRMHTRDHKAE